MQQYMSEALQEEQKQLDEIGGQLFSAIAARLWRPEKWEVNLYDADRRFE